MVSLSLCSYLLCFYLLRIIFYFIYIQYKKIYLKIWRTTYYIKM